MTELMRRRRALMGVASQGGILPSGYRQVSAIRIPLDGIISTGLAPTATSVISITARINSDFSATRTIWGVKGNGGTAAKIMSVKGYSGSGTDITWQLYAKYVQCGNKKDNNKHTFVSNVATRGIEIDGDIFTVDYSLQEIPTRSILLSADYVSVSSWDYGVKSDLTVWAYSHSSNTQRTQTLIPCQQLSNNEYGLFDLEGNVFIGNIGSGIITEDNT